MWDGGIWVGGGDFIKMATTTVLVWYIFNTLQLNPVTTKGHRVRYRFLMDTADSHGTKMVTKAVVWG